MYGSAREKGIRTLPLSRVGDWITVSRRNIVDGRGRRNSLVRAKMCSNL